MTSKLNLSVYGVNYLGRERRIVAAKSRAEAGRLFGVSIHTMKQFSSTTANKEEIELAMREPGVVWTRPYTGFNVPWTQVNPRML